MRLYLSSFRMGDHPEKLARLAGRGASVAVIANAMDDAPDDATPVSSASSRLSPTSSFELRRWTCASTSRRRQSLRD